MTQALPQELELTKLNAVLHLSTLRMDPQTNWLKLISVTISVIKYTNRSAKGGRADSGSSCKTQSIMKGGAGSRRVPQQELEAVL